MWFFIDICTGGDLQKNALLNETHYTQNKIELIHIFALGVFEQQNLEIFESCYQQGMLILLQNRIAHICICGGEDVLALKNDLCDCNPKNKLTQTRLETYITVLMRCISNNTSIQEHFSTSEIIEILHYGADLFVEEPILLEFNLTNNGLFILGNLCGSIHSLLRIFDEHGLPPRRRYLFLGGYVGQGRQQLEIIMLLLLMKLRWPQHLFLLRSNYETVEAMKADNVPTTSHQNLFAELR
uniref:protein-serine/threonine phosphatase n=1 Tax=Loa loa TaxID=7209 RepID=A0A1I7W0S5_LOALO